MLSSHIHTTPDSRRRHESRVGPGPRRGIGVFPTPMRTNQSSRPHRRSNTVPDPNSRPAAVLGWVSAEGSGSRALGCWVSAGATRRAGPCVFAAAGGDRWAFRMVTPRTCAVSTIACPTPPDDRVAPPLRHREIPHCAIGRAVEMCKWRFRSEWGRRGGRSGSRSRQFHHRSATRSRTSRRRPARGTASSEVPFPLVREPRCGRRAR